MKLFLANLATIIIASIAGFLCWNGNEGWGWFLIVAAIIAVVPASKEDKEDKE